MPQTNLTIRWHQIPQIEKEKIALPEMTIASAGVVEQETLLSTVLRVGIPVVEGATTAKEYAIGLLKLAAEVEHALMAQYLYAAFSLSDEEAPDSINYHRKTLAIAIQEMGHLITVQNLLLLVGGPEAFYMQRDLIRTGSEKNPIPFVLEPISKPSLAKYVAAEKPAQVPKDMSAKVDELVKLAAKDGGVEPHRVGVIYELLKWIFLSEAKAPDAAINFALLAPLPDKPHISDEDLRDNHELVPKFEATREEWRVHDQGMILAKIHTVAEAWEALDHIAKQGEGLTNGGSSHFTEFMEMVHAFEAGSFSVKPIPKSPTLDGAFGGLISHPYARLWCEVFNSQYNLLVLTIYHALVTARPDDESAGLRGALADMAIRSMRQVIHPLADLITALPLRADGSADKAAPTFTLDASILNSIDQKCLVTQHLRLLDGLVNLYGVIELSSDFASFPDHANTLADLRDIDQLRRELVSQPGPSPT